MLRSYGLNLVPFALSNYSAALQRDWISNDERTHARLFRHRPVSRQADGFLAHSRTPRHPNLLHYDPAFAAASRWGKLVAPQSFPIAADDGHGAVPACVGRIENSHLLFGGDEWWFEDRRVFGGDMIFTPTRSC
jgi:hypothetical protein